MSDYLLKSIPGMIFEPMAVVMLLWCISALFFFKKKDKLFFWIITAAIFLMLLWRIICSSVMVSSRYSSFLIYPTVIFCACFCVKIIPFLRFIFRKSKWNSHKWRKLYVFVALFVIIGLNIGSLIKITKFNKYSDYTKKICQKYLSQANKSNVLCTVEEEINRVAWYTKKNPSEIQLISTEQEFSELKKYIEKWQDSPSGNYFIFYRNKKDMEPDAKNLNILPDSWSIISSEYTSKRKNKEMILAYYKPLYPNTEEWNGKIPALPAKNLCRNGDFEKSLSAESLANMKKYYTENGVKGYTNLTDKKLPHDWWLTLNKWNGSNPPDMRLESSRPLAGKYSFLMDGICSNKVAQANCMSYIYNKKCKYNLFVRPEGKNVSKFTILTISRNEKTKKYLRTYERCFLLQPGKIYRIYGNIPTDTFPDGFRNFCLLLATSGAVTVDQVSLVEY